jgi:hypothetical protein
MPWARLDDKAITNIKLRKLSHAAFRVWALGLVYCQSELTDGFVPTEALSMFPLRDSELHKAVAELVTPQIRGKAPLWAGSEGGYEVHDFLEWNESRAEILAYRQKKRDQKRGERQRGASPVVSPVVSPATGPATDLAVPPPSHTNPTHTNTKSPSGSLPAAPADNAENVDELAERFDCFWQAYPKKVGKGDALKAFRKLRVSAALLDKMLVAIDEQRDSRQWREDSKFIPNPSTWLNQTRWEDELEPAQRAMGEAPAFERWVCPHVDHCGHRAMCEVKNLNPTKYPKREEVE